ncbi:MAG TPA: pseudouridine-5'-phosphate glycosidase [Anaerolineales bacterium]|nr:pseudouridine-5'-phosphate glycosidase [Anaerolineales bacterium]
MPEPNLKDFIVNDEIQNALAHGQPVVALESTVITHGLPYPQNIDLARKMEETIREHGATPATIALVQGKIRVGVSAQEIDELAQDTALHKISVRDIGPALALGWSGGTTVASTSLIAQMAGVRVFATGGIGGVHREPPYDVSADLWQLAQTPIIVVCAGAKAILDLPATLEVLETSSVPVVGYQTDYFPAFYSLSSGLPLSVRVDQPEQVARIAQSHWGLGLKSAVLVVAPPPAEVALAPEVVQSAIDDALREAEASKIRGQAMTPFLLSKVNERTQGASLKANLGLLLNNARIAALIAVQLAK